MVLRADGAMKLTDCDPNRASLHCENAAVLRRSPLSAAVA